MANHNAFNSVSDTDTTEQLSFFDTSDTDNDTTADGKTHRVYTLEDKEKGKQRIAGTIDFVRTEADALRLFLSLFMKKVHAGEKVSGNLVSYLARSKDITSHDGKKFSIRNDWSPVLVRMIVLQWPEYAPLCDTSACVLDDDDLRPLIVPLGDIIDLGDLLSA